MSDEELRYPRVEYARKFLVPPRTEWRSDVEPYSKRFEDKYLRNARLRLRILTDSDTGRRVIKLNKKFESDSPYSLTTSRILLSQGEYELLDALEGDKLNKVRYYHHYRGQIFWVDVFEGELDGLVLCETEAEGFDDLMAAEPPPYALHEVSEDPFFTGGNLCRTSREDLLRKLSAYS
ncbi:MAG TPA: hypothetical protein VF791_12345 [Pyrinomonadaceae bacterium]